MIVMFMKVIMVMMMFMVMFIMLMVRVVISGLINKSSVDSRPEISCSLSVKEQGTVGKDPKIALLLGNADLLGF